MSTTKIRKNDKRIKAFSEELVSTLQNGKRFQVKGFGTFSTCSRKAAEGRPACKMAMFRAATELRDYAMGGAFPEMEESHAEIVQTIIEAMQSEEGIDVPFLGRMAVVPVKGKNPKIIFHAAEELNSRIE